MNPHQHLNLIILVVAIIGALLILLQKLRAGRSEESGNPLSPGKRVIKTQFRTNFSIGQAASSDLSSLPLHGTKTSVQTKIKLNRQMGKSDFPKIHLVAGGSGGSILEGVEVKAVRDDGREASASADIAAGTPVAPEPGSEIDLGPAFRKIAAELCEGLGSKTRVKYTISIRESVMGQTIPVNLPQMTANLWPDGLENLPFS